MDRQKECIDNLKRYKSLGINPRTQWFKKYNGAGLLKEIDEAYIDETQRYWQKHYERNVDPLFHVAFMNLTGKKDPRVIPGKIMRNEIMPYFNDPKIRGTYQDKNLYDILIPTNRSVETVLKHVHGLYYDTNNNEIDRTAAVTELLKYRENLIIKPSNTNDGKGIKKLYYREKALFLGDEKLMIDMLEEMYGADFMVQKVIAQHPVMAAPHPDSVNTLRMVTLRWKHEVRHLLTFARFGTGNSVQDNAGTGGVCLGVTDDGQFMEVAIDEHCKTYTHHPTTNCSFKELPAIPNFDLFKEYVEDLHKEILHHDYISWDIAVGSDGLPVFLEANFAGATWLYQMSTQRPLFGELTAEILEEVYRAQNDENSPRRERLSISEERKRKLKKVENRIGKLRNKTKSLRKEKDELQERIGHMEVEFQELQKKNQALLQEVGRYKKKYNEMKQSRSWKLMAPLRKMGSLFKK